LQAAAAGRAEKPPATDADATGRPCVEAERLREAEGLPTVAEHWDHHRAYLAAASGSSTGTACDSQRSNETVSISHGATHVIPVRLGHPHWGRARHAGLLLRRHPRLRWHPRLRRLRRHLLRCNARATHRRWRLAKKRRTRASCTVGVCTTELRRPRRARSTRRSQMRLLLRVRELAGTGRRWHGLTVRTVHGRRRRLLRRPLGGG